MITHHLSLIMAFAKAVEMSVTATADNVPPQTGTTRSHLSDYTITFIRLHDHIYQTTRSHLWFYDYIYILLNFPNKTFSSKALMKHTKCTKTTSDYARMVKTRFQINAGIVLCSEFNSFPFFFTIVPRSFLSHQTNVSKLFAILNLDKLHFILLVFFFTFKAVLRVSGLTWKFQKEFL